MTTTPRNFPEGLAQIPWWAVIFVIAIGASGLAMLYSAAGGAFHPWASSQMWRFLPGIILMVGIAATPVTFWLRWAYPLYGVSLLMLLAVTVMGHMGLGAQRWVNVGGVNVQPSEFTKLTVILALARYFHRLPPLKYPGLPHLIPPLLIAGIPAAFILKQPNLGTTTILLGVTGWVAFAAGVRLRYFLVLFCLILGGAPVAWHVMHDYQKQRVMTFLDPSVDPLGAGYNITQSMIAIGSGGVTGQGFLAGSQAQLDFLPEKHTDFIFTMLAEEFGFIGGVTVLGAYCLMVVYAIAVSIRCRHLFGKLVAQGIAGLMSLHMAINVAMVMGLIPVVGVPLPLFSYGGSIMITMMLGFGLLFNSWVWRDEKLRGPGA